MLFLMFELRLHFVILLTMDLYFLLCFFFVSLKKFLGQICSGFFFHRLNDLILGNFKINPISALPSPLFKLVVCFTDWFVEISFFLVLEIFSLFAKI